MKPNTLLGALAFSSIVFAGMPASAVEAHHPDQKEAVKEPAKETISTEQTIRNMQGNNRKMQSLLEQMAGTKDPQVRQKLAQEHMMLMQENMRMTQHMGGGMMGGMPMGQHMSGDMMGGMHMGGGMMGGMPMGQHMGGGMMGGMPMGQMGSPMMKPGMNMAAGTKGQGCQRCIQGSSGMMPMEPNDAMNRRLESMEKRLDLMQMMMERMPMGRAGNAAPSAK